MKVAILVPCYNEEQTVEKVVTDFRSELPESTIYVYDNNSSDRTSEIAKTAGAIVRKEPKLGKVNVVSSMFRDIDADLYVMVDGDDTYPAHAIHDIISTGMKSRADMVVGDRLSNKSYRNENKRRFHNFGNSIIVKLVNVVFKSNLADIFSGYRVFSRRFIKNYATLIYGFELETDLSLFALHYDLTIREVPIHYKDRPEGSESKLNTYKDGFRVIRTFFNLFRYYKPLKFFSSISLLFFLLGLICGAFPIIDYITKVSQFS